ncbi:MAG: hypothetical protein HDR28_02565 [Lachnospiraceae bacterium]|nr:hypothetical protein [Lachnospiraceae bacterium]
MNYLNAAEILPEHLLKELQMYVDGDILYIPKTSYSRKAWGAVNGSRIFYQERNKEIQRLFRLGSSIDDLADQYGLAYSTIKKIVYC